MIPSSVAAELRFRTAVVGGGIVGLAIGARLAQNTGNQSNARSLSTSPSDDSNNVVVLEAHRHFLSETSSRNSGVVHAGIYYPPSSLKTALCMAGNKNIWRLAKRFPTLSARQCGKWIGACDVDEEAVLESLLNNMHDRGISDARYLSNREISDAEPNLKMSKVVLSPSTGIVDVHSLGNLFINSIRDPAHKSWASESSTVTSVQIDYDRVKHGKAPCVITVTSTTTDDGAGVVDAASSSYTIEVDTVVFSTGLHSNKIGQEIPINITSSPDSAASAAFMHMKRELENKKTYYCKGRYVGYRGGKKPLVNRLVYPCPLPNLKGLGVHSVIDLAGGLKFGPDAHYISDVDDVSMMEAGGDSAESSLLCDQFHAAISRYLPCIERDRLYVDFTGIRPKLAQDGEGFRDFDVSTYRLGGNGEKGEAGATSTITTTNPPTLVVLKGIESPGLTASTAIADMVASGIWGPEVSLSTTPSLWAK